MALGYHHYKRLSKRQHRATEKNQLQLQVNLVLHHPLDQRHIQEDKPEISQKTATSQDVQLQSVQNVEKDIKVVITSKDTVQPPKIKKQTAHRGKKFSGVKPNNMGNCLLTLNEQKWINTDDTDVNVNVIEDCHIQTTDSSYGDWLIQQGITNLDDVKLETLVLPNIDLDIHKKTQSDAANLGPLEKVVNTVPSASELFVNMADYLLSDEDIEQCEK